MLCSSFDCVARVTDKCATKVGAWGHREAPGMADVLVFWGKTMHRGRGRGDSTSGYVVSGTAKVQASGLEGGCAWQFPCSLMVSPLIVPLYVWQLAVCQGTC
jgi:hypothetical protein